LRDGDRGHWIPFLEWMVTTSCDLACSGCDRFIDHNHNWTEDFDLLKERMTEWSKHLDPDNLTLIGGEPLIHPRIYDIIKLSKKLFDHANLEIYTNGLLLSKKPKLVETFLDNGGGKISITLHNQNPQVRNKINENIEKYIFKQYSWRRSGISSWKFRDIEFEITDTTEGGWYDYRRNINGKLKPWNDNDPQASYAACGANIFPIVYDGRVYKCPPISMVKTHLKKFNRLDDPDWQRYLKYQGVGLEDSEEELEKFVDNVHKPHEICGMCPANPLLKPQEEAVIKHRIK